MHTSHGRCKELSMDRSPALAQDFTNCVSLCVLCTVRTRSAEISDCYAGVEIPDFGRPTCQTCQRVQS